MLALDGLRSARAGRQGLGCVRLVQRVVGLAGSYAAINRRRASAHLSPQPKKTKFVFERIHAPPLLFVIEDVTGDLPRADKNVERTRFSGFTGHNANLQNNNV